MPQQPELRSGLHARLFDGNKRLRSNRVFTTSQGQLEVVPGLFRRAEHSIVDARFHLARNSYSSGVAARRDGFGTDPPPLASTRRFGRTWGCAMRRTPRAEVQLTFLLAGALALLSGMGSLVGWFAGWEGLLRFRAGWPAMAPATAIGLVGCGVAALGAGLGRARVPSLAAAGVAALMGALGLGGFDLAPTRWIAGDAAADVRPLSMTTAVCLLLAGGSLSLLLTGSRVLARAAPAFWISGVIVACFSGAALLAHVTGVGLYYDSWSQLTGMAAPTAVSLLALGLANLTVLGRMREPTESHFSWMGIGVGVGTGLATLALWAALVGEERRHIERTVMHVVATARFHLARDLNERLNNLVRMAERWAVGRVPLREEWEADAKLHVSHDPGAEAVAWVDPAGFPRLLVSRPGSDLEPATVERQVRADDPGRTRQARLSRSFPLEGGGQALAMYAPIWEGESYRGCIVAVFRAGSALWPALQDTWEHYDVVIRDAGGELLRLVRSEEAPRLAREDELRVGGVSWQIRAWPRPARLAELQSAALELALGAGLALAVLAGSTVSLARTARQRLRSVQGLLESAPDAMVVVDSQGTILLVNAETERLFAHPRSELVGHNVDRLVPERLLPSHRAGLQRYFAEPHRRPDGPLEVVARRRDGSEFPVEIVLGAIASERGLLVSSAIRDLTGRRDEELRRRLAAIVTASSDAILGTRADGTIVDWNPGAERNYGWSAQEAIGRHISFLEPEEHSGEMERILARVRRGEAVEQHETVRLRKDGERIAVSLTVSPIRGEHGAVVGAASIGRDVSELKRAREDLRAQRDAMASANAELARSNADLDQFAAVVSHDLKSPLRGMSSLAEWLAEDHADALGEEGREQLLLLQARAQRMYRLIDGILEYSRAGRTRELASVDSRETMLDILDALEPHEGIEVVIGADLPTVVFDEAQLTQVLQNLVSNAIVHLGRATGTVQVDARERADEWEFRVADDGVGIPEEHRERVFRVFQTLSRKGDSTGVGLAVVKKIVESNGGHVWIADRAGGGTEFWFTVPKRKP